MNKNNQGQNKFIQLATFDMFGISPKFYTNNQERHKTIWGFFLTICLIGCVFIACWVYGKDLYLKENPTTIVTETVTQHPERFDIRKNTFNFGIGLQGSDWSHYIDESIYKLEMTLEVRKQVFENGEKKTQKDNITIPTRPCQHSDFGIDKQFFDNFTETTSLICPQSYDSLFIEGDFGADVYSTLVMRFYYCQEDGETQTDKPQQCQPKEQIMERLKQNYFAIYFTDQILNSKDYENPFQQTGRSLYTIINAEQYKQQVYFFQNQFLEDNTGIIFDDIQKSKSLSYSSTQQEIKNNVGDDGNFLKIVIRMEQIKEKRIYRKYLHLAEVIAQVGGILKVLTIAFFLISKIVSSQQYNINMANSVFSFNIPQKVNNQDQKKQQQQQISERSFFQLLFPFCLNKKKKEEQQYLNFATQKLREKLDINYILNKFVEIEKIKMLIMNNNQRKLFDYIQKPVIDKDIIDNIKQFKQSNLKNQNQEKENQIQNSTMTMSYLELQDQSEYFNNMFLVSQDLNQDQIKDQAIQAYQQLSQKQNKKDIDKKILALMDKEIKQKFSKELKIYEYNNIPQLKMIKNELQESGGDNKISNFKESNFSKVNIKQSQNQDKVNQVEEGINQQNNIIVSPRRSPQQSLLSHKTENNEENIDNIDDIFGSQQLPYFLKDQSINMDKITSSKRKKKKNIQNPQNVDIKKEKK